MIQCVARHPEAAWQRLCAFPGGAHLSQRSRHLRLVLALTVERRKNWIEAIRYLNMDYL
jgi:hypothetical protein